MERGRVTMIDVQYCDTPYIIYILSVRGKTASKFKKKLIKKHENVLIILIS